MDIDTLLNFCKKTPGDKLDKPFSIGNYTCASNGASLIIVPKMDDVPECNKDLEESINEIIQNIVATEWMPLSEINIPEGDPCEFCEGKKKAFSCPECKGRGYIKFQTDRHFYTVDCEECASLGEIDLCPDCKGFGVDQYARTEIMGKLLSDNHLRLFMSLPECKIGKTPGDKAARLEFAGGMGFLMPIIEG